MITEKIELYKTRDLGERINVSFAFIKQNGKQISKNLLYLVPFIVVAAIILAYVQSMSYASVYGASPLTSIAGGVWTMLGSFAALIATSVASFLAYLFVIAFISEYEASPDGTVVDSAVWDVVKQSFWGCVGGSILIALAVSFGLVFCVLPGIWIGVCFSVFYAAYIDGRKKDISGGVVDCMTESYYLVKSQWFPSFGYLFVVSMIGYAIYMFLYIPSLIGTFVMALTPDGSGMSGLFAMLFFTVASILAYTGYLFMSVITSTATTLLYFDLKERQEGVSLQKQIDNIGQSNL